MTDPKTRHRSAHLRSASFDPDAYTVEIVWSTGATVRRWDPWSGDEFDETLSMDDGAVRLDRLNAGAAFLDAHDSTDCARVVGSVVRGSARIEDGKGICTVLLSRARDVADIVTKIREGVIRNVSVGYWVHRYETTEGDGEVPEKLARDWEPLEISAVPVPADPGSQIRSAGSGRRASPPMSEFERGRRHFARLTGRTPAPSPAASRGLDVLPGSRRASREAEEAADRRRRRQATEDFKRGQAVFKRLRRLGFGRN